MSGHCGNLGSDRALGSYWERAFAELALRWGYSFTTHQIGKNKSAIAECRSRGSPNIFTLPDVTIWTAPGHHYEIKHKIPTKYQTYGYEAYRFNTLVWFWKETNQPVLYTIHDYSWCGNRDNTICRIEDWRVASIEKLFGRQKLTRDGASYINGQRTICTIHYWDVSLFRPLREYWEYLKNQAA
jgi:hypothetical protein